MLFVGHGHYVTRSAAHCPRGRRPREVYVAAFHIHREQTDPQPVTHIRAVGALCQHAFHGRVEHPHPSPLGAGAGHERVELLAHLLPQEEGGRGFAHLPLHLGRGVLFLRALLRQLVQLLHAVGGRYPSQGRLEQALGHQVGVPAVGGGGVSVILDRQPEMPRGCALRRLGQVLARAQELDHRQRKVRKAQGVLGLGGRQELLQRAGIGFSRQLVPVLGGQLARCGPTSPDYAPPAV